MLKKITLLLLAGTISISTIAAPTLTKEEISTKVKAKMPFNVVAIEDAPIKGFYQLITEKGVIYIDHEGEHLISGNIFSFSDKVTNLTKIRKDRIYRELLTEYKDTVISYVAENPKYEVNVFTDIDCGYCQKLHAQIPQYNELGITINFFAFPRNGLDPKTQRKSTTFKKMEYIWCEDDKNTALHLATQLPHSVPTNVTCTNPVEAHYNLGVAFGVQGTPAVYDANANLISAYLSPEQLFDKLESKN